MKGREGGNRKWIRKGRTGTIVRLGEGGSGGEEVEVGS